MKHLKLFETGEDLTGWTKDLFDLTTEFTLEVDYSTSWSIPLLTSQITKSTCDILKDYNCIPGKVNHKSRAGAAIIGSVIHNYIIDGKFVGKELYDLFPAKMKVFESTEIRLGQKNPEGEMNKFKFILYWNEVQGVYKKTN